MKKIPTLFERIFDDHHAVETTKNVIPGMEWVLQGEGIATVKIDGACCAVKNGIFYKRFDAKSGKPAPYGAIPCCDPDHVTGHWPHWVALDPTNPADKWFYKAFKNAMNEGIQLSDGTYEAIGPHFNNNPYQLEKDTVVHHGDIVIDVERSYEGLKQYLTDHVMEGIVFWKDGQPQCKIKRRDFGLKWPVKGETNEKP